MSGKGKRKVYMVPTPAKRPTLQSSLDLHVQRVLGYGGFGLVQEARWKQRDMAVAIKSYRRQVDHDDASFTQELHVLRTMQHAFMPKFFGMFCCADDSRHLILQLCPGGDLLTAMQQCVVSGDVFFYVVELVAVIAHLHEHGLMHGDIKLENVFIDDEGHIKLGDYGSSTYTTGWNDGVTGVRGSRCYIAPEMFFQPSYGLAADMWALGCVLFELYVQQGTPPFDPETMSGVASLLHMLPQVQQLDPLVVDLMRRLLDTNPETRISIADVQKHKLFADVPWDKVAGKAWKVPPWVPEKDHDGFDPEFTSMPTIALRPTTIRLV